MLKHGLVTLGAELLELLPHRDDGEILFGLGHLRLGGVLVGVLLGDLRQRLFHELLELRQLTERRRQLLNLGLEDVKAILGLLGDVLGHLCLVVMLGHVALLCFRPQDV